MSGPPPLAGVLETALYHEPAETEAMRRFYAEVLGLRAVTSWKAGAAFRLGTGVCLLFDRAQTAIQSLPHSATGSAHACFVAPAGEYQAWKRHLENQGVELIEEATWDEEVRSFYFKDPAGNLLEIAERDIWPT